MDMRMLHISASASPELGATKIFDQLLTAEVPTQETILNYFQTASWLEGIALLACGVVYLLYGWKAYKPLVMVNAALVGAILGAHLGGMYEGGKNMTAIGAVIGSVALMLVCLPFRKYAVSVMAGLAGALMGFAFWNTVAEAIGQPSFSEYAWAGALIGLIGLGLLAFVALRPTVMVFTCVQGGVMIIGGLMTLLFKFSSPRDEIESWLHGTPMLLALSIFVAVIIGLAFQYAAEMKQDKKKKQATQGAAA